MVQLIYLDVDSYDVVDNENVYVNDLFESFNYIVYVDLVFDQGLKNVCYWVFCVFEIKGSLNEKMIFFIMYVYINEIEVEYVFLILDGEILESDLDFDESYYLYLDIDEEIECEKFKWFKDMFE